MPHVCNDVKNAEDHAVACFHAPAVREEFWESHEDEHSH